MLFLEMRRVDNSLSYVGLLAGSYRSTSNADRNVMGMELMRENPEALSAKFEGSGVRIAFSQRCHITETPDVPGLRGEGHPHVVGVLAVNNVDPTHRKLKSRRVQSSSLHPGRTRTDAFVRPVCATPTAMSLRSTSRSRPRSRTQCEGMMQWRN